MPNASTENRIKGKTQKGQHVFSLATPAGSGFSSHSDLITGVAKTANSYMSNPFNKNHVKMKRQKRSKKNFSLFQVMAICMSKKLNMLSSHGLWNFCQAQNTLEPVFGRSSARGLLGKLTTLGRGTFPPHSLLVFWVYRHFLYCTKHTAASLHGASWYAEQKGSMI